MAAAMLFPAAAEVRADDHGKGQVTTVKSSLVIRVVESIQAGIPVDIKVYSNNNKAVEGATVYALSTDNLTAFSSAQQSSKYADIAVQNGDILGDTDANGSVKHTFSEAGVYILVAVKDGFNPASRKINVRAPEKEQLVIRAPGSAEVSENVTIGVYTRADKDPVTDADIYAMKYSELIETVMPGTANRKQDKEISQNTGNSKGPVPGEQIAVSGYQPGFDEVISKGVLLGSTDENGELICSFAESGVYALVAVKDGYNSASARISIGKGVDNNLLLIRTPGTTAIGQEITIGVYERKENAPVGDASLYILKIRAVPSLTNTENGTATQKVFQATPLSVENQLYVEDAVNSGQLIGETDDNGKFVYSFDEAGVYIIVAVKDGYNSGVARIQVRAGSVQNSLKVIVRSSSPIDKEITIKVTGQAGKQEADAEVYIIKGSDLMIASENSTPDADIYSRAQYYADYAQANGLFIGTTDENGQITYTFTEAGRYIIVAIKDGFNPGFARTNVGISMSNALAFRFPSHAAVDEEVNIYVMDRESHEAVPGADIYTYRINGFGEMIGHFFRETFAFGNSAREKYADAVSSSGEYIGTTDENGLLVYSFNEEGSYVLVTFKSGYAPDFGRIEISRPGSKNNND